MPDEIPDQARSGTCATCAKPMIIQKVYNNNPARWRALGAVRQASGDTCKTCSQRKSREAGNGRAKSKPRRAPIDPAVVAQLRAAAGLPAERAS